MHHLMSDSGLGYLDQLNTVAREDVEGLKKAQASYGNSWKSRGGVGAFMMLARKWDRLENILERTSTIPGTDTVEPQPVSAYDIFAHVAADTRAEGVIDDIRDLRRYLMLVESELRARGLQATHRDNNEGEDCGD